MTLPGSWHLAIDEGEVVKKIRGRFTNFPRYRLFVMLVGRTVACPRQVNFSNYGAGEEKNWQTGQAWRSAIRQTGCKRWTRPGYWHSAHNNIEVVLTLRTQYNIIEIVNISKSWVSRTFLSIRSKMVNTGGWRGLPALTTGITRIVMTKSNGRNTLEIGQVSGGAGRN